jgi:signal transduction histidine kinase
MNLKTKLSFHSTLLCAVILALVLVPAFLIFKIYMKDFFYGKIKDTAQESAYLFFEKDLVGTIDFKKYKEIENQLSSITKRAIRVYNAKTLEIYLKDHLDFQIDRHILKTIIKQKELSFQMGDRQFVGLLCKDNLGDFIVVVSGIDYYGEKQIEILGWIFVFFYIIALPLNYFIGSFLSRKTFQPFDEVIAKVNTITAENLHSRLEVSDKSGEDEIKKLTVTFNYLLERLESDIEIQKNFLKNASHELKTPLTVIIGDIEVGLQTARTNDEYLELLSSLRKDSLHLKSIIEGLLVLSGLQIHEPEQLEMVRIDEIIWNIIEKKAIEYPESKVSFKLGLTASDSHLLTVQANRYLLLIALLNIVDNAIKFSSPKEVIIVASKLNQQLFLQIIDQGMGISNADIESVFDMFFRSKRTHIIKGMGLGLYITNQILERHRITISLKSEIEKGTTVALLFPV